MSGILLLIMIGTSDYFYTTRYDNVWSIEECIERGESFIENSVWGGDGRGFATIRYVCLTDRENDENNSSRR